jgi:RNA polymerase sigma-70 factor (ECF subfamily)
MQMCRAGGPTLAPIVPELSKLAPRPATYLRCAALIDEQTQPADGLSPGVTDRSRAPSPAAAPPTSQVESWLAQHGDFLWRFALSRTRSRDAAEEVVQETVLAALRSQSTFAGDSSERTWLLGIAAHKIADHFRAARRRATESDQQDAQARDHDKAEFDAMFTPKGMWARPPAAWGLDAGSKAEDAEMLAALRRCVESLPPSLAEAVWLRDLMNIPSAEVCRSMGISPTNLWSRTHRARSALRACVERSMGLSKGDAR